MEQREIGGMKGTMKIKITMKIRKYLAWAGTENTVYLC